MHDTSEEFFEDDPGGWVSNEGGIESHGMELISSLA